jgi:hypothetical protein
LWPSILSHRRQPAASLAPGPDQALRDAYLHGARLRRVGNAPGWVATKRPRWGGGEDTVANLADGGSIRILDLSNVWALGTVAKTTQGSAVSRGRPHRACGSRVSVRGG